MTFRRERLFADSNTWWSFELQVKQLESRLHHLTEDQVRNDKKQEKLKDENGQLIERYGVC